MASAALPPGFAPVMIDGKPYWDGGIVSNTPLQYVLDNRGNAKTLVAQVDLFSARGALPMNLADVMSRHKHIMFSSRTRFNTGEAAQIVHQRQAIARLIDKLPASLQNDPDVQELAAGGHTGHVDIVHLIYRQSRFELESKDDEFARVALREHWQAGQRDVHNTLTHPDWLTKSDPNDGVTVDDLSHASQPAAQPAA